ncbi:glycosyltransferase, group 2 family [Treponema primitia ZAS-2]|uniref:Glycosyltransferase, group 2 family n=1 Tax=Treponema primitia (strain ATCC BAA-887 / DSM 12427 / ZAS-2) TaxID=545694 RepID=F5YMC9_TREPZ|nr:glycosyltransferase family 2 protein [Treponema primitia]AEF85586.1 glycosyltransferase, group 2 family [Treponema primitia ZAS-2]
MKISIITVCYNSESTIRDTFESVLKQNYPDIEYIVIDGQSTDMTVTLIKEYECKFRGRMRWISEHDKGIYDAMNKGIKMASDSIIGILNADDFYTSNDILEIVNKTITEKDVDSCFGNLLYIKDDKPYRYWKSGKNRAFKYGWMPPHPTFFVKKSIYEKYGLYRFDCGLNADYELMLRLLDKNKISTIWIDKTFVYMRAGGSSNNGIRSRINAVIDDKNAWVVNKLSMPFFVLLLKKARKFPQFFLSIFYRFHNV